MKWDDGWKVFATSYTGVYEFSFDGKAFGAAKLAFAGDAKYQNNQYTGAPPGDAMVTVSGLPTPVAPGSTVGGCLLINAIKAEVAARLTAAGQPPPVLTGSALVGAERAAELFEAAYDEHARRLAKLFATIGTDA